MTTDEEDDVRARALPLEIVWRNPLCLIRAKLRLREASNLYYGWTNTSRTNSRAPHELRSQSQLAAPRHRLRRARITPHRNSAPHH